MKKIPVSIAVLLSLCVGFAHQSLAYEDEEIYMNWSYATGEDKAARSALTQTAGLNNLQTVTVNETFTSSQKSYTPTYQIVNQTQSGGTVYGTNAQNSKTYSNSSSGVYNTSSTGAYGTQVGDILAVSSDSAVRGQTAAVLPQRLPWAEPMRIRPAICPRTKHRPAQITPRHAWAMLMVLRPGHRWIL